MEFEEISALRRYQQIAEQIILSIRAGKILPGDKLPSERELSDQFSVSRSSVREALIALEVQGFVEVRAGQGVTVLPPPLPKASSRSSKTAASPPTSKKAAAKAPTLLESLEGISPFDILDSRLLIEMETAAQAAINATKEDVQQISQIAKSMKALAKQGITPSEEDRQFHEAIAKASGNPLLLAAVRLCWQAMIQSQLLDRLEKHYLNQHSWLNASLEHDEIVKAIVNRDPFSASRAMREHLVCIGLRLRHEPEAG